MRSFLAFQVPQVEVRCFVGPSHIFLPSSMHRIHGTSIFTYILLIFMVHVGKYIRPSHMDPIGYTGIRYTWQPASIRYTSAISHKHLDLRISLRYFERTHGFHLQVPQEKVRNELLGEIHQFVIDALLQTKMAMNLVMFENYLHLSRTARV